jgi:homeobox protein YOX1/YHP1
MHATNSIRSPTASYSLAYVPYAQHQADMYSYPAVQDPRDAHHAIASGHRPQVAQVGPLPYDRVISSRPDGRERLAYPGNRHSVSLTYDPSSTSFLAPEESSIKKKRRRADANQLRVLNETYNRTAFPSAEERAALAKKLDMSARSIQIWYYSLQLLRCWN